MAQNSRYVYLNNVCLPAAEACVAVEDRAFLYGESVFTTLRCYGGTPFLLDRHCARLNASLVSPEIDIPYEVDPSLLRTQIDDLLVRNACPDAAVRYMVSRGCGAGPLPPAGASPTILLTVRPYAPPTELYARGARLHIASVRRDGEGRLERHKIGSYLPNLLARREAQANGCDEAVLTSATGAVLECACSNLFLLKDGCLHTPPLTQNLLPGITRACVLACALAAKIPVVEAPLSVADLTEADEVFLTNALLELVPAYIGEELPDARPVTAMLQAAYREFVIGNL